MMPLMQEEMLGNEDNMENLKSVFLEFDIDNSGTLSVEELWNAVKKLGADVDLEAVI
jgi:Ca2+-binding EF-hand superfamily protein|tara:strand:+ start:202 stop:372 length:171 start_codon:yes stop_codon:yes gene_type:complete